MHNDQPCRSWHPGMRPKGLRAWEQRGRRSNRCLRVGLDAQAQPPPGKANHGGVVPELHRPGVRDLLRDGHNR
eukprot:scaffold89045_cov32-Tisochrysis_lutea.AAC.3